MANGLKLFLSQGDALVGALGYLIVHIIYNVHFFVFIILSVIVFGFFKTYRALALMLATTISVMVAWLMHSHDFSFYVLVNIWPLSNGLYPTYILGQLWIEIFATIFSSILTFKIIPTEVISFNAT